MSFGDLKISEAAIQSTGVQSQPDTLTGSAPDNKLVFDALPTLIIQKLNSLLDLLGGTGAAGEMPIAPIDGMTATTVQQALAELRQALTAYINLVQGITGAAQVGVSAISGMQAQNAQAALGELKALIDNLVIGALPPGSVTADMIADGAIVQIGALLAVAAAAAYDPEGSYAVGDYCTHGGKLHKCGTAIPGGEAWTAEHWTATSVAEELAKVYSLLAPLSGATTPQAALAALGAGVRNNELDNPYFEVNQRDWSSGTPVYAYSLDRYYSNNIQVENLSQGVKLTPNGSSNLFLVQRITEEKAKAFEGKKFILSIYIDEDNFYFGTITFPQFKSGSAQTAISFLGWSVQAFSLLDGETGFGIYPNSSSSSSISPIVWKAEMGENQTLAYKDTNDKWHLLPQPESDYATQLAKCQRYFQKIDTKQIGVGMTETDDIWFSWGFPVEMRTTPVATIKNLPTFPYGKISDVTATGTKWVSATTKGMSCSFLVPSGSYDFQVPVPANNSVIIFELSADL